MFGYVKPVVKELLVKENEFYKATYCGICRSMKKHTGILSNLTLSYDAVFLALCRMAYIEDGELGSSMRRCAAHPLKKRCMLKDNGAIEYTSRVFAILTHYKLLDDINDERFTRRMLVRLARPVTQHSVKLADLLPLELRARELLSRIGELEENRCSSADLPAELFGELLGEMFSFGLIGEGALVMYSVGFHLGKFIYCADAAEDYEKDRKSGSYNPYVLTYGGELTEDNKQTIRCALLLECRKLESAVNLIPFGKKYTAEGIVRNIIYLGLVKRIDFLNGKTDSKKGEKE